MPTAKKGFVKLKVLTNQSIHGRGGGEKHGDVTAEHKHILRK